MYSRGTQVTNLVSSAHSCTGDNRHQSSCNAITTPPKSGIASTKQDVQATRPHPVCHQSSLPPNTCLHLGLQAPRPSRMMRRPHAFHFWVHADSAFLPAFKQFFLFSTHNWTPEARNASSVSFTSFASHRSFHRHPQVDSPKGGSGCVFWCRHSPSAWMALHRR